MSTQSEDDIIALWKKVLLWFIFILWSPVALPLALIIILAGKLGMGDNVFVNMFRVISVAPVIVTGQIVDADKYINKIYFFAQ